MLKLNRIYAKSIKNPYKKIFNLKLFSTHDNTNYDFKNMSNDNVFSYLNERGHISNISNKDLISDKGSIVFQNLLKSNARVYIGFDPTAESLHLGNLIGILTALRFSAFGIEPIFLVGGATGQIGDPSGKNKERPLLHKDKVLYNFKQIEDNISNTLQVILSSSDFQNFSNEKSKNRSIKRDTTTSSSDEEEYMAKQFMKVMTESNNTKISDDKYFENIGDMTNFNTSNEKNNLLDLKPGLDPQKILKNLEEGQKKMNKIQIKNQDYIFKKREVYRRIVNNLDFYKDLNIIDFLREVGTNLRMGPLLSRETVKNRLKNDNEGLSLTEFMYQTFQGYDFLKLYEKFNVQIQIGGSDQWGNMLAGYELVKKIKNVEVINMTFPLMTTANGQKFGKSEGNALFINPQLTPINNIYQYFLNLADSDLHKMFCAFTFLEKNEIDHIINFHFKNPDIRNGQKILAEKIVSLLFSSEEAEKCANNTQAHYLNLSNLESQNFDSIFNNCHKISIDEKCIENMCISKLCVNQKIIPTKAQCKRLIDSGSLYINDSKVEEDVVLKKEMLIGGKYLVVKTGKKHTHIFELLNETKLNYI
jgi:tyrosyl-tRNA synthetase